MVLRYIYNEEAEPVFREKLLGFHEEMVDSLEMFGTAKSGSDLEEVPMHRLFNDLAYCSKIIGGLKNTKPLFQMLCENENGTKHAECLVYYIINDEIEDWYLWQNIYDHPKIGETMYQIWKMKLILPSSINNYWRE